MMMTQVSNRRWLISAMLSAAVVLSVALLLLFCSNASAATPVTIDGFLDRFKNEAQDIGDKLKEIAIWLFWTLAFIEFSWAAIQLGVKGDLSMGAIWGMLFKQIIFIGFFWWLLQHWDTLADTIVGGLGETIAIRVKGTDYRPTAILKKGIEALWLIVKVGWKAGWSDFFVSVFAGLMMYLAFSLAAGALCVYMVEWYIGVPIGVLLLGLGGSSWTKNYPETYVRFLISLGLKFLTVKIILMIVMDFLDELMLDLNAKASDPGFLAAGALLGSLSVIAYMLIQQVPGISSAMLSGASMQTSASTLTSAVTGAAGNMRSILNSAQTAAQSATSAGIKMAGVAKSAGAAAKGAYGNASSFVNKALGGEEGGGGGGLKSALRGVASGGAGLIAAGGSAIKSVGKDAIMGAGRGIAGWAGISKQEDSMARMSRNVAAIANKLGVNDPPEGNEIKPGRGGKPVKPQNDNGGLPETTPDKTPAQRLKDMENATNEQNGRGDAV